MPSTPEHTAEEESFYSRLREEDLVRLQVSDELPILSFEGRRNTLIHREVVDQFAQLATTDTSIYN